MIFLIMLLLNKLHYLLSFILGSSSILKDLTLLTVTTTYKYVHLSVCTLCGLPLMLTKGLVVDKFIFPLFQDVYNLYLNFTQFQRDSLIMPPSDHFLTSE